MVGPQHAEKVEWLYLNSCTDLRTAGNRESRYQTHSRTTTQIDRTCSSRDERNKDPKNNQPARSSHSLSKHKGSSRDPKSTHNIRARKAFKKVCSSLLLPVEEVRGDKVDKNDSRPSVSSGGERMQPPHDPATCKAEFLQKLHLLLGEETNSGKHDMSGDCVEATKSPKPIKKADTSTSTPALKSASTQSQAIAETEQETEDEDQVPIKSKVQSTGTQLAVAGIFLFFFFCVVKTATLMKR